MRVALGIALLLSCASLTPEQRSANTEEARHLPAGTVLTDAQMDRLDQDTTLVCENRPDTGSHIPHRTCQTLRQANEERVRNENHGLTNVEQQ